MKDKLWLVAVCLLSVLQMGCNKRTFCVADIPVNSDCPVIMAHKMAPEKGYTENSLVTLKYNLQTFPGVIQEIDVQTTKDERCILMHDDRLERTSTGYGKIAEKTLQELETVRLKDTDGNVTEEKIPLLEEVLRVAKGRAMLMLDMKPGANPAPMMEEVKKAGMERNVIVICYSLKDGVEMHSRYSELMLALGFNTMETIEAIKASGLPEKQLVALLPRQVSKEHLKMVQTMGVRISYSAQNGIDLAEKPIDKYHEVMETGISILCTDSVRNALIAVKKSTPVD